MFFGWHSRGIVSCRVLSWALCHFVIPQLCSASTSTCRSINHILDSLPQQCATSYHTSNDTAPTQVLLATYVTRPELFPSVDRQHPDASGAVQPSPNTDSPQSSDEPECMNLEVQKSSPIHSEIDASSNDGGFLSFEDWKRLNLLQSSGSAGEVGETPNLHHFREAPQPREEPRDQAVDSISDEVDIQHESFSYGKTSKERFNYASFDCAAAVLKSNPEAKGSSSILDENRDRYMLNRCGASNKYVTIEMCEDILVDTIVLANFEFFSSTFKEVRISVTDRYPTNDRSWKILGTFIGSNSREIQVFAVENPLIWARYVKIEFLSHYGNEFYCPLTLLRIHGTTMMEEYKNQENAKHEEYRLDVSILSSLHLENASASAEAAYNDPYQTPSVSNKGSPESSSEQIRASELITDHMEKLKMTNESNNQTTGQDTIVTSISSNELFSCERDRSSEDITSGALQESVQNSSTAMEISAEPLQSLNQETSPEKINSTSVTSEKPELSVGISSPASPTTQESVYKTITKRLSLLEANATLSLRYIEEQSQLLRDVFNKMERRHSQKIDTFLTDLNTTIAMRLQYFRQQYDQLWQSTVVELENQRQASRDELITISARLSLLADELVFQKRVGIAQSVMLLVTLLFVLTTRGVKLDYSPSPRAGTGAELPLLTLSPSTRRASSALTEPQPIADQIKEYGKRKLSRGVINRTKRMAHSAPETPASSIKSWNSPRGSPLSRYPATSDEEMEHSDSDFRELRLRIIDRGSDDEFQEMPPKNGFVDIDYPTPPNNEEMYE